MGVTWLSSIESDMAADETRQALLQTIRTKKALTFYMEVRMERKTVQYVNTSVQT